MNALKDPLYRFPGNYGVEKFLELFSGNCTCSLLTLQSDFICAYETKKKWKSQFIKYHKKKLFHYFSSSIILGMVNFYPLAAQREFLIIIMSLSST